MFTTGETANEQNTMRSIQESQHVLEQIRDSLAEIAKQQMIANQLAYLNACTSSHASRMETYDMWDDVTAELIRGVKR